jgi:hypothetical protein
VNDQPGGPGTAARLANVPGDQKLAPLSSADDERGPRKVANAITETRTSKLGKRFPEAIATSHPRTCPRYEHCGPCLQINKADNTVRGSSAEISCRWQNCDGLRFRVPVRRKSIGGESGVGRPCATWTGFGGTHIEANLPYHPLYCALLEVDK